MFERCCGGNSVVFDWFVDRVHFYKNLFKAIFNNLLLLDEETVKEQQCNH